MDILEGLKLNGQSFVICGLVWFTYALHDNTMVGGSNRDASTRGTRGSHTRQIIFDVFFVCQRPGLGAMVRQERWYILEKSRKTQTPSLPVALLFAVLCSICTPFRSGLPRFSSCRPRVTHFSCSLRTARYGDQVLENRG